MDSDSVTSKKIFDLTDVFEESNGKNNQEVIVIDGRGYEKNTKNNDIHNLLDAGKDSQLPINLNDELIQRITEIAERIAREIIPDIAERVVREEIENLKKISIDVSTSND